MLDGGRVRHRGVRRHPLRRHGANRQPAVAYYARKPGEGAYRPFALDVLRIEDGEITEIVAFPVSAAFGLPPTL